MTGTREVATRARRRRAERGAPLRELEPARCGFCGRELPAPGQNGGKPRKWCDQECARAGRDSDRCECGRLKSKRARRCDHCAGVSIREASADRVRARRERYERLWAEGKLIREIAEVMGITAPTAADAITELRKQGANLPYRKPRRAKEASRT